MEEKDLNFEYPLTLNEAKLYTYNYWSTKPVMQLNTTSSQSSNIIPSLKKIEIESKLPISMYWMKIKDDHNLAHIANFLNNNYQKNETFKLQYTSDFIKWILGNDGYMLTILTKNDNSICGCIGVSFKNLRVFEKKDKFAMAHLLCVHDVFKKKKMAQLLMDELSRRVVLDGVNQGCF